MVLQRIPALLGVLACCSLLLACTSAQNIVLPSNCLQATDYSKDFNEEYIEKMQSAEEPYQVILSSGFKFSCQEFSFGKNGSYNYSYVDHFNVRNNFTFEYTAVAASNSSPGHISLAVVPTILSAYLSNPLTLTVIRATDSYLVLYSCSDFPFFLSAEQVLVLVPKSKHSAEEAEELKKVVGEVPALKERGHVTNINYTSNTCSALDSPTRFTIFSLAGQFGRWITFLWNSTFPSLVSPSPSRGLFYSAFPGVYLPTNLPLDPHTNQISTSYSIQAEPGKNYQIITPIPSPTPQIPLSTTSNVYQPPYFVPAPLSAPLQYTQQFPSQQSASAGVFSNPIYQPVYSSGSHSQLPQLVFGGNIVPSVTPVETSTGNLAVHSVGIAGSQTPSHRTTFYTSEYAQPAEFSPFSYSIPTNIYSNFPKDVQQIPVMYY